MSMHRDESCSAGLVLILSLIVLLGAWQVQRAEGATPVTFFTMSPSTSQAGGHPDIVTHYRISNKSSQPPVPCECNSVKEITIDTPPGLVGSPTDTPRCTQSEFAVFECPSDSQIGVTVIDLGPGTIGESHWIQPLYNMVPHPDQLALWATYTPFIPLPSIFVAIAARTEADYGLELRTFGIPSQPVAPEEFAIVTWGVPADPAHDPLRFPPDLAKTFYYSVGCNPMPGGPLASVVENFFPAECNLHEPWAPIPANFPAVPYFSNPTTCTGPLAAAIETLAYDLERSNAETAYPETVGCDQLSFNPSLTAKPTTSEADAPSGLDVDLTVPQTLSPATPSPSAIRAVQVELPPGFTINPNAANGKLSCTAAEARFGTRDPAQCPETAKIGTLGVTSSSFPAVLPGAMYLGEPLPGDRYRVLLVFDGFSLHVKLPGTATPDPATGQLTVSFRDLPQFSFQDFDMHVFGAERGLLATPTRCGTYAVRSTFTPWAAPHLPTQTSTQFFTIDSGPRGGPCPPASRPFAPRFAAGVRDNTGGSHSPFSLSLERPDGEQGLSGLTVRTPPGFSAGISGIPYCPETAIARVSRSAYSGLEELSASSCPVASQVGTVVAGAGAGSRPLYVGGKVYLAGPYRDAPLSLLVVVPAVSGPYDLGNVAIRVAVYVDPLTAQVTAVSDPLPQIVEGIPLRTRSIQVHLDRPDFALNPTNCDPFSVDALASGDQGGRADLSAHFQVANCADLSYRPRLSLRFSGGVERRGHPAIRAVLTSRPGEANSRRISVTLPPGSLLDNAHIGTVCTRVAFAANACPASARIGRVSVTTPLLDRPLSGLAYLRSSRNDLPDIALDLEGQFDVEAIGRVDSVDARLRTTFETVPDVPISRVVLNLAGGRKGLIQNSVSLCGAVRRASVRMTGQNGVTVDRRTALDVPCGKKGRKR
jgi:hypothetical protein